MGAHQLHQSPIGESESDQSMDRRPTLIQPQYPPSLGYHTFLKQAGKKCNISQLISNGISVYSVARSLRARYLKETTLRHVVPKSNPRPSHYQRLFSLLCCGGLRAWVEGYIQYCCAGFGEACCVPGASNLL